MISENTDKPEIGLEKNMTIQRSQGRSVRGESGSLGLEGGGPNREEHEHGFHLEGPLRSWVL